MSHILDISLLKRDREFGLLYLGQFISFLGTMISYVVVPYQVYALSHSNLMVGILSLMQLLPLLVTALLGGVFADRYNRRNLLIYSELFLAVSSLLLAANAWRIQPGLSPIFIITFMMSAVNGLHRPALESMTQQIVPPANYTKVAALISFKYGFCMIVGPAIGGLIIAHHGVIFTYFLDFLSFAISCGCLAAMHRIPKPVITSHPSILQSVKDGLSFAVSKQELLGSYLADIISMIFAMPNALFPAIAEQLGGPKTLGLLYAAPAVGALLISFVSGWTSRITHDGRAIALAAAFWGLTVLGFGLSLSYSLALALFFLALSGVLDTISGIFRQSLWNRTIPHEFRSRLAGIEMISYISGPKLGDARAGLVATGFGMTTALVSGGILCFVGVSICCLLLPKFWNYHNQAN